MHIIGATPANPTRHAAIQSGPAPDKRCLCIGPPIVDHVLPPPASANGRSCTQHPETSKRKVSRYSRSSRFYVGCSDAEDTRIHGHRMGLPAIGLLENPAAAFQKFGRTRRGGGKQIAQAEVGSAVNRIYSPRSSA